MIYTNSYDLIKELYRRELLKGMRIGIRGELSLDSKITDSNLLQLLNEVWVAWAGSSEGDEVNGLHQGYYNLYLDHKGDVSLGITIDEDLKDFHGDIFNHEKILTLIKEGLKLECINPNEDLYSQMGVDLELRYDSNQLDDNLENLSVYSADDKQLSVELKEKEQHLEEAKLKARIIDYLVETSCEHCGSYDRLYINIEGGGTWQYQGLGYEGRGNIKDFMKAYEIDFEWKGNK
ncbi:hypothetical protein LNTAR_15112 [Lentisphaera araneosa HTCC2155]|uniref:Uncharacterized protein n=1 Tax=Lentisphaera araneosa HTCC2155 TaxID=313628 RepID=A6DRE7_9BACT|nr:hypothetical protein [Lentisphaera araneosa]EDM25757.1 hypothetical protein LNTAR_15112 [Lentisphaera araneosa HTCC2155]